MSKKRQNYMRQADVLFSKVIRERDGHCKAAGQHDVQCSGSLQCCHIIGRGERAIRTYEPNAIAMCQAHHMFFTHRPAAWLDFIDQEFPGLVFHLRSKAREERYLKVDWRAERDRLKAVLERLEAA